MPSCTTMPTRINNRIPAGSRTRKYDEDDLEYSEFLDINHQDNDRTRALTSQLQQADRANRQPLAILSAAAGNKLQQAATPAGVATNATTTRAQAQQQRLVRKESKPRKLLPSNVINNQPSLRNRPPTLLPNHIPLNQLGAGETSPDRSSTFAGPYHHRHTTSLMQELSTEDFRTDQEPESGQEDMADDGEESEIEE